MFHEKEEMKSGIQKTFHLSSILTIDEQILFLEQLMKEKNSEGRQQLIDRTLNGERLWENDSPG